MTPDKFLAIGGSAGSLQVILAVLAAIGEEFPMPVLVILHRNVGFESSLEDLVASRTGRIIREVEEKEQPRNGAIYLCPPDYHVLIEKDGSFSLDYSERVHFSRPSIDVSFRSAADVFGSGVTALLLSGGNADGAEGLKFVKERGGVTIVQEPASAEVPYMPQHAIVRMTPDFVLSAKAIPPFIRDRGYQ